MFGLDKMFGGGEEESSNPFKSILGTLGSGITAGFTGNLVDSMFGKDPADEALDMMDTLYPGTTPYERLSNGANTSSAGALESLSQKSLNAQINAQKVNADITRENIAQQKKNVEDTNTSHVIASIINANKGSMFGTSGNPLGVSLSGLIAPWLKNRGLEIPDKPTGPSNDGVSNPYLDAYTPEDLKQMGIPYSGNSPYNSNTRFIDVAKPRKK